MNLSLFCSTYNWWYLWLCACCFQYQSLLSQEACSKWTQSMAQMSEPLQKVQTLTLCLAPSGHGAAWAGGRKQDELKWRVSGVSRGRVQMGCNERATLKCKESTEHRGKDLCIWRPALSGSYSLPLLTDAVCFSLCLALPWKTNAGNHCALSPTALFRLHHGWATLC